MAVWSASTAFYESHFGSPDAARIILREAAESGLERVGWDILRLYGVSLLDRSQDERRATLERLDLRRTSGVALSPVHSDGQALRAATTQRGLSGVLAKRRDAPYRAGPDGAWVRVANRYRRGRGR